MKRKERLKCSHKNEPNYLEVRRKLMRTERSTNNKSWHSKCFSSYCKKNSRLWTVSEKIVR